MWGMTLIKIQPVAALNLMCSSLKVENRGYKLTIIFITTKNVIAVVPQGFIDGPIYQWSSTLLDWNNAV